METEKAYLEKRESYANKHTRAYLRHQMFVHMQRKKKLVHELFGENTDKKEVHKLSKGKAHSSVRPSHALKTRRDGWKHSDRMNLARMNYQFD